MITKKVLSDLNVSDMDEFYQDLYNSQNQTSFYNDMLNTMSSKQKKEYKSHCESMKLQKSIKETYRNSR